jgi:hypothetical protein
MRRLTRTEAIFGLWMLLVGAFIGLVVANDPSLARAPVPPIVWPLAAALLFDLGVMHLSAAGRVPPLSMGARVAGFVAAGLVYMAVLALMD